MTAMIVGAMVMLLTNIATTKAGLILAGIGSHSVEYRPNLVEDPESFSINGFAVFVSLSPIIDPSLSLLSSTFSGVETSSCNGGITEYSANGTFHWSDFSTSDYVLTRAWMQRIDGHLVATFSGNITDGKYEGSIVKHLALGLATQLSGCLAESGVSSSTGSTIVIIEN